MNVELPPQGQGAEPHHVPFALDQASQSLLGNRESEKCRRCSSKDLPGVYIRKIYSATNGSGYIPIIALSASKDNYG